MKELYKKLYEACIQKDEMKLNELLDESFQIIHVNGMIQTKVEFIQSIVKGMIQYESFTIQKWDETMMEDKAVIMIDNKVSANFFLTGSRTWNLSEKVALLRKDRWYIYRILVTSSR